MTRLFCRECFGTGLLPGSIGDIVPILPFLGKLLAAEAIDGFEIEYCGFSIQAYQARLVAKCKRLSNRIEADDCWNTVFNERNDLVAHVGYLQLSVTTWKLHNSFVQASMLSRFRSC